MDCELSKLQWDQEAPWRGWKMIRSFCYVNWNLVFLLLNVIQFVPFYLQYVFFFAPFCWPYRDFEAPGLSKAGYFPGGNCGISGGEIPLDWHEWSSPPWILSENFSLSKRNSLVARYWIGVELPADAEEAEAEASACRKVKSLQDRPLLVSLWMFMGPLQNGLVWSFGSG